MKQFFGAWGAALHSFYRSTLERCKAVHRWQSAGPGKNADQLTVTYVQRRSEKVVRVICWTKQWCSYVCLNYYLVHFEVVKYVGGTEIGYISGFLLCLSCIVKYIGFLCISLVWIMISCLFSITLSLSFNNSCFSTFHFTQTACSYLNKVWFRFQLQNALFPPKVQIYSKM